MDLEHALALFVLMLVSQVPLMVAAVIAYLRSNIAITEARRATTEAVDTAKAAGLGAVKAAQLAAGEAVLAKDRSIENGQALASIHTMVNDQRTQMEQKIEELMKKVAGMEKTAAVLQERAAERGVDLPRMGK